MTRERSHPPEGQRERDEGRLSPMLIRIIAVILRIEIPIVIE